MSYICPDFDSINEDALSQLQTNQVPEGKSIEYKLTLELDNDKDGKGWKMLLKEITAFANGSGGDLLYGIEAKDGLPTGIPGLAALNFDATVLRLQNLLRSHVQPRLFGVRFRAVPLANGNAVLAVRVPRSSGPFMLENRFYLRTGPEARPMDFVEVSRSFFESEATSNQLRNFRFERCAAILANEAALEMRDKSFVVLHVVPLEAVGQPHRFSIQELLSFEDRLWPIGAIGASPGVCAEGVFKFTNSRETKTSTAYTMLLRSGAMESVQGSWLSIHSDEKGKEFRYIRDTALERGVIDSVGANLRLMTALELNPPFVVFLSLLNARGYELCLDRFHYPSLHYRNESPQIRTEHHYSLEIVIEDVSQDLGRALRPAFDGIWNACGVPGSSNYNEVGDWSERRR